MSDLPKKIIARTCLHSTYVNNLGNGDDGVVVSEIVEFEDGTTEPRLRKFRNPQISFWVTQPQYRNHKDKKELERLDHVDEFRCTQSEMDREVSRQLTGRVPNFLNRHERKKLYQSPYLYGGNISVEARVAMKYKKDLLAAGKIAHEPTTGFLDIETSLLPGTYGKIPLIIFTHENKCYLAMKRSFMYEKRGDRHVVVTEADVRNATQKYIVPMVKEFFHDLKGLKDYTDRLPIEFNYFVGDTELEMVTWILDSIHAAKTSFVGVWNIDYDLPRLIKVVEDAGVSLESVFSHPSLRGSGFSYANYRADKRKNVQHITNKWHWMAATAHYQMVDSMCLFSNIRTVLGKESSYKLGDILAKFGLGGKFKIQGIEDLENLPEADWHRKMLSDYFTFYALYAIWDGLGLQMLEWLNNDLTAMMLLGDTTPPKHFPMQTIRVTNTLHEEWLRKGFVLGTGVGVEGHADDELDNKGGAVLSPEFLMAKGMKLFKEWKNFATHCYSWINDFDFSAQYPRNIMILNMAKATKLATMLGITAEWVQKRYTPMEAIEVYCSYLMASHANGVEIGVEFFDLPDYEEMNDLFVSEFKGVTIDGELADIDESIAVTQRQVSYEEVEKELDFEIKYRDPVYMEE